MIKKIGLLCIGVILCVVFLKVVDNIEERQTTVATPDQLIVDSLQEKFGEGKSFEEFLAREDFGEFFELELEQCPKEPEFANGAYYSADARMVSEVAGILGEYEYYYGEVGADVFNSYSTYLDFRLRGKQGMDLEIWIRQVSEDSEVILIDIMAESIAGTMTEEMVHRWYPTIMYADAAILERIMTCLKENLGTMSLKMAEEKIASAGAILESSDFLCMRHEEKEYYSNNETEDSYTIYTQPLSDYQGYLELYEVYICCSGQNICSRDRLLFKVELYDNDGNFQRELYSNMENYNAVIGRLRED